MMLHRHFVAAEAAEEKQIVPEPAESEPVREVTIKEGSPVKASRSKPATKKR